MSGFVLSERVIICGKLFAVEILRTRQLFLFLLKILKSTRRVNVDKKVAFERKQKWLISMLAAIAYGHKKEEFFSA